MTKLERHLTTVTGPVVLVEIIDRPKVRQVFGNKTKIHRSYLTFDTLEQAGEWIKAAHKDRYTSYTRRAFKTGADALAHVKRYPVG